MNPATAYKDQILRLNGETWPRVRNPPAWAQHRQEMADALPWFRSTQGGVQLTRAPQPNESQQQFVEGILIAGFGGSRTYMDGEILITSINGASGSTPASPMTQRRHDAMQMTIATGRPVGIVVERGATFSPDQPGNRRTASGAPPLFPCNNVPNTGPLGHNCWVGDFFLPVYMWLERLPMARGKEGRIWMVKLEKWDLETQSWWANATHGPVPRNHERNGGHTRWETCPTCQQTSPRIYQEFFICLNERCSACWTKNGQLIMADEKLTYTVEFLQERQPRPLTVGLPPLIEDFHTWWTNEYMYSMKRGQQITQANVETWRRNLLKGFCCPYCKMLNRRVRWSEWHCRNETCNNSNPYRVVGHPPMVTLQQAQAIDRNRPLPEFATLNGYQRTTDLPLFTSYEYKLAEGCYVAYLLPKEGTNALPGGADQLYQRMQELANSGELGLERRGHSSKAGPVLTGHFAVNYGELYRFSARVGTIPWDDPKTPPELIHARDTVNGWTKPYRRDSDDPANELYIAGYWASQRMGWHDDGERGLQDLITTYTLGGQGMFKFRMKHHLNIGQNGIYGRQDADGDDDGDGDGDGDDNNDNHGKATPRAKRLIEFDPVIPGCAKEHERRALKDRLDREEITQAEWKQQFQQLMRGTRVTRGVGTSDRNVVLQFPVNHGCLVLMYGPNTQSYFEHCVAVDTPVRFALTFRNITTAHYENFNKTDHKRKLLYDLSYAPGDDWDKPRDPSPVDSRPTTPLPSVSEWDDEALPPPPPPKRPRTDGDDGDHGDDDDDDDDDDNDDDDAMQGVVMGRPPTSAPAQQQANVPAGRGTGGRRTRSSARSSVSRTPAPKTGRRSTRSRPK